MRPERKHLSMVNLNKRGVPTQYHLHTYDDLDDFGSPERKVVIDYIKEYIKDIHQRFEINEGIFLYGSNGVGKSYIASLIVKYAYQFRYTSKRCTFTEYITEYTSLWNIKDSEALEEATGLFYHNFKSVEFLVIEEIGKELDTKLAPTVLEDLLRYREEKKLVTIICTNLEPKEVVSRYGNSIGSLIQGNFTPIRLVGADNRKRAFRLRGVK